MSGFKAMVAADRTAVFLGNDFFGELYRGQLLLTKQVVVQFV